MALNWVWTGDAIQVGAFGFAVAVVWGGAVLLAGASRRESLRTGPPPPASEPEGVPTASLGAVLVAVSIAAIVFGAAFGRFFVYFGAGLLVVSAGLVLREWAGQRRARRDRLDGKPR
jgi:hypothetical protein